MSNIIAVCITEEKFHVSNIIYLILILGFASKTEFEVTPQILSHIEAGDRASHLMTSVNFWSAPRKLPACWCV